MKYFTKEYYSIMQKTNIHLLMRVTKKAEKFYGKYNQDLYNEELKNY